MLAASPGGFSTASLSAIVNEILSLIVLESNGVPIHPDTYIWRGCRIAREIDPPLASIRYENLRAYSYAEPRIGIIERTLAYLTMHGVFMTGNATLTIDGFRLFPLTQWRTYGTISLARALGPLSPACNLKCEFCYEAGNALVFDRKAPSLRESRTRISYYDADKKRALPVPLRVGCEDFCNPHALELLEEVRVRSDELINLTTNGSQLTSETVGRLSAIKPILICISMNSVDPGIRYSLMGDPSPEIAIQSPRLLREAGIPFIGSIVPWRPFDIDDLERTIRFLDSHEALSIRICLPGFSKYFSAEPPFMTDEVWPRILDRVRALRTEVRCPLIPTPAQAGSDEIEAVIDGVYFRSPAWNAGLRVADVILSVNGKAVFTRREANALLGEAAMEDRIRLEFRRRKENLFVEFEATGQAGEAPLADGYPFWPQGYRGPIGDNGCGIFLIGDLWKDELAQIVHLAGRHRAHKVLLLSTVLMRRNLLRIMEMLRMAAPSWSEAIELRVAVTEQEFWGGNIIVGDLNMVSDFITTLGNILDRTDYRPDLVVIPSSFANSWGFDLQGRSFREIEWTFDIPVERIVVKRIYL